MTAARPPARPPAPRTLALYGLTPAEWRRILKRQRGGCGVCGNVPLSGVLHIDHEHTKRWKHMERKKRRPYVRGLLCWQCNSVWLRRGATPGRLRAAAAYLERYEKEKK